MRLGSVGLAAALSLGCIAAAHAETPWYVGVSGGAYLRNTESGPTTIVDFDTGVRARGTIRESFNPGSVLSASVGYKLPLHFRIEGEFSYVNYQASQVSPRSAAFPALNGTFSQISGGNYYRYVGTINLFYDLPLASAYIPFTGGRVTPYVGGGAGGDTGNGTSGLFSNGTSTFRTGAGSRTTAVALGELGFTIKLDDTWAVIPAYRFLHYFRDASSSGDENANIFKIGLRYSFQ